ncbi:MAG: hypothetical protein BWY00_01727 [Firmicutes bacterium ADurb.Bin153]|nr:MAG: hypothetical protein BWY00_01727 [Firmicutes bacterium ADurb.Bin153]
MQSLPSAIVPPRLKAKLPRVSEEDPPAFPFRTTAPVATCKDVSMLRVAPAATSSEAVPLVRLKVLVPPVSFALWVVIGRLNTHPVAEDVIVLLWSAWP